VRVTCTVNGEPAVADDVWEGESLLFLLRERLGLPGSKNACEQGECGSCTVYLEGRPVCACLVAAGQVQGLAVRTVEGLAGADVLNPVQRAFLDAGAVQCGFCTPGLIVAADDLLRRVPSPGEAEIREALAGNLCRCTGYEKIIDAVRLAAARQSGAAADQPAAEWRSGGAGQPGATGQPGAARRSGPGAGNSAAAGGQSGARASRPGETGDSPAGQAVGGSR